MRLAVTILVFILAGCGTTLPSGTPNPSTTPALPPFSPAPSETAASSGPVVIDPSLLDHLPTQVDGLDVMRRPETDVAAVADSTVRQYGEAIVTALVIDPPTSEFAYVVLVRLRPDAFSEELYRSWRDSFDEGACSQAGGVIRQAVAQIAGREVHIDSCQGGLRTYHVWLENSRILVSVSSAGQRKLGELLVAGLRD